MAFSYRFEVDQADRRPTPQPMSRSDSESLLSSHKTLRAALDWVNREPRSMSDDTVVLESVDDPSIADPLSDVTRQERKSLLIASLVAVALAKGGLVPQRIEALGIELTTSEVKSLLYILAAALAYFIAGFTLYATADLRRRKVTIATGRARAKVVIDSVLNEYKKAGPPGAPAGSRDIEALGPLATIADQTRLARGLLRVSAARLVFDAYLPILLGLGALALVLHETRGFPGWHPAALVVGSLAALAGAICAWRSRARIGHLLAVRVNRLRMWRVKRLSPKLKELAPGSPEHARLMAKTKRLLERSVKGPFG